MTDIPIPPEAIEAAMDAITACDENVSTAALAAACRAMLKAWPGMRERYNYVRHGDEVVLPLPTENSNAR